MQLYFPYAYHLLFGYKEINLLDQKENTVAWARAYDAVSYKPGGGKTNASWISDCVVGLGLTSQPARSSK